MTAERPHTHTAYRRRADGTRCEKNDYGGIICGDRGGGEAGGYVSAGARVGTADVRVQPRRVRPVPQLLSPPPLCDTLCRMRDAKSAVLQAYIYVYIVCRAKCSRASDEGCESINNIIIRYATALLLILLLKIGNGTATKKNINRYKFSPKLRLL